MHVCGMNSHLYRHMYYHMETMYILYQKCVYASSIIEGILNIAKIVVYMLVHN